MTLWLAQTAHNVIVAESRKRRVVETGGPLFGYRAGEDVVVTRAFGPGPKARHRPRSLVPDHEATQATINAVRNESGGHESYLGEWHTHPLGPARPSGRDATSLVEISKQHGVELHRPVSVIQATKPLFAHLRIGELAAFEWDGVETLYEVEVTIFAADDPDKVPA